MPSDNKASKGRQGHTKSPRFLVLWKVKQCKHTALSTDSTSQHGAQGAACWHRNSGARSNLTGKQSGMQRGWHEGILTNYQRSYRKSREKKIICSAYNAPTQTLSTRTWPNVLFCSRKASQAGLNCTVLAQLCSTGPICRRRSQAVRCCRWVL